jgi:hypothetical protein
MVALPAAAAVVVEEVVAAAAGVAVELVLALEVELLELPHAASATAQAAVATIPTARNLAVLRVVIVAPTVEVFSDPPMWRAICEDPNRGQILPAAGAGRRAGRSDYAPGPQ